jgi:hypothetical protein
MPSLGVQPREQHPADYTKPLPSAKAYQFYFVDEVKLLRIPLLGAICMSRDFTKFSGSHIQARAE